MSEPPPEQQTQQQRLEDSLITFTQAIGDAVSDICSFGLTIGESYVPFNPDEDDEDCTDEDVACSQVWVRVTNVSPKESEDGFGGNGCALTLSMGLEVGVLRCIEIAEGGEAPTASQVLTAAMQNLDDMNAILCAAMGTEVWDAIEVGQWVPTGPLGGQYGGIWNFTVEL